MLRSRHYITALILLLISAYAKADCEELAAKLSLAVSDRDGAAVQHTFNVCKAWPNDPGRSIVAVARLPAVPGSSTGDLTGGMYDLEVLVVNTHTGEISQRFVKKNALASDAVSLTGISIDTAPYVLTAGIRAFGVRAVFEHTGGTNVRFETLNLYASGPGVLQELLSDLVLKKSRSESLHDCFNSLTEERTLRVSGKGARGYADLIVNEHRKKRDVRIVGDRCVEVEKATTTRYVLRFNGVRYVVPKVLKYL